MRKVFYINETRRLIFVESAVAQMLAFRQHSWWQTEAGGVLLGRHLIESENLVVDEVSTPQKSDRRSRFGFFRSKRHETVARDRWAQQTSTSAYLGLWHTHPQVDPVPSDVDLSDWRQAVSQDTFEGNNLFFPIIGTERIRVWTLSRDGKFSELKEEQRQNG
jgi:integrative and conjugative element protein (TIGR02256 family)